MKRILGIISVCIVFICGSCDIDNETAGTIGRTASENASINVTNESTYDTDHEEIPLYNIVNERESANTIESAKPVSSETTSVLVMTAPETGTFAGTAAEDTDVPEEYILKLPEDTFYTAALVESSTNDVSIIKTEEPGTPAETTTSNQPMRTFQSETSLPESILSTTPYEIEPASTTSYETEPALTTVIHNSVTSTYKTTTTTKTVTSNDDVIELPFDEF